MRTSPTIIGNHGRRISAQTETPWDSSLRWPTATAKTQTCPHLQWCRTHVGWQARHWNRVLFSDESRFTLERSDGRARIYRRSGECFSDPCVKEANRFRGGSVMVWAGISNASKTNLVVINWNLNAQCYRDEILAPVVIPYINANGNAILQQDNARPHTARLTTQFL